MKVTAPVARANAAPAPAVEQVAKASAQDLVIVTPTYAAKKEDAEEPTVKAADAASKFVERPGRQFVAGRQRFHAGAVVRDCWKLSSSTSAVEPAVNLAAEQKTKAHSAASGPKYTGEPVSVNLKDVDLKDFFRLIHEISGLNVVLDPEVKGNSYDRAR